MLMLSHGVTIDKPTLIISTTKYFLNAERWTTTFSGIRHNNNNLKQGLPAHPKGWVKAETSDFSLIDRTVLSRSESIFC